MTAWITLLRFAFVNQQRIYFEKLIQTATMRGSFNKFFHFDRLPVPSLSLHHSNWHGIAPGFEEIELSKVNPTPHMRRSVLEDRSKYVLVEHRHRR
jgi:hypothetical protein